MLINGSKDDGVSENNADISKDNTYVGKDNAELSWCWFCNADVKYNTDVGKDDIQGVES